METIGWRDRRRSRVREVADGAGMLFTDVAVIRTLVVVGVMLVVAFLARKHSKFVLWLVVASVFFMFCEMFNTITEMLVDRISLETHPFSARIKHASAFVSAVSGLIAFSLLFVVLYNLLISPNTTTSCAPAAPPAAAELPPLPPAPPPDFPDSLIHSKMWDHRVASKRRYRKRGLKTPCPDRGCPLAVTEPPLPPRAAAPQE